MGQKKTVSCFLVLSDGWIYEGFEIAKLVVVVLDLDPQFQTNQHISFKMCVF